MSKLYKSVVLALTFCLVLFAFAQDVTADQTDSGVIGALQLGQTAKGSLLGDAEVATYHTYYVDVPAGTPSLTIRMEADMDLDLAAKFGSEIQDYDEDADYIDQEVENSAFFVIENPQPGRWYIDVINYWTDELGSYTLSVK